MKLISIKHLALTAAFIAVSGAAATAQQPVQRTVISSGAVHASAAGVRVKGTVGQPAAGFVGNGANSATLGFWQSVLRPTASAVIADRIYNVGLSIAPNVAATSATLSITLERAAVMQVVVLDMLGRVAVRVRDGVADAGTHTFDINVAALAPGRYNAVIGIDGFSKSVGFVVVR